MVPSPNLMVWVMCSLIGSSPNLIVVDPPSPQLPCWLSSCHVLFREAEVRDDELVIGKWFAIAIFCQCVGQASVALKFH